MENEVFERDYQCERECPKKITDKDMVKVSQKAKVLDSIQESICKATNAVVTKHHCVVQKDKESYDNLLHRLDAYAVRHHGKIKGVVDYKEWYAYIIVELNHFEICHSDDFALLSDLATKTDSITFTEKNGGIRLSITMNYFKELEDDTAKCIIGDEMLTEHYNTEKEKALSDPQIAEILNNMGSQKGMNADEMYDWLAECYQSDHDCFISFLFCYLLFDDDNDKDAE